METVVCVKGIIKHQNRVLIVKRSMTDEFGHGEWEFPGGRVEIFEAPIDALVREIREEIGVEIREAKLAYISSFFLKPDLKCFAINYITDILSNELKLSEEHEEYLWIQVEQLDKYLPQSILEDYNSFVATGTSVISANRKKEIKNE